MSCADAGAVFGGEGGHGGGGGGGGVYSTGGSGDDDDDDDNNSNIRISNKMDEQMLFGSHASSCHLCIKKLLPLPRACLINILT